MYDLREGDTPEDLETPDLEDDDLEPDADGAGGDGGDGDGVGAGLGDEDDDEEDESTRHLPDDLLDDEQRERRAASARKRSEATTRRQREERPNELVSALREVFGEMRTQTQAQPEPQRRQQQKPPPLTTEQRIAINQKILEDPEGIVKAVEWARQQGRADALAEFQSSSGGALELAVETAVDKFSARKLRDPQAKYAKQIEPFFERLCGERDLSGISQMSRGDRDNMFSDMWDLAAGRFMQAGGALQRPPSPGVGRGSGRSAAGRRRPVKVYTMSESEKAQLRASAPNRFKGPEGEKIFRKQVAEIEYGVTSDQGVASQVRDATRFSNAVARGGA